MIFDVENENKRAINAIHVKVKREGNPRHGLELIGRAKLLQTKTSRLCDSLSYWRSLVTVGTPDTHVRSLFLGDEGKNLMNNLKSYIDWLNAEFKDLELPSFASFTQTMTNYTYNYTPDELLLFHFTNTTAVTANAWLTQLQIEILQYAQLVMKKLEDAKINSDHFGIPRFSIGVTNNSPVIKVGDSYRAEIFIASHISKAAHKATINDSPTPVQDGSACLSFKVRAIPHSVPAHINKVTRYWKGSITFKSKGRDTTLYIKKPYNVLRKSVYTPQNNK
ncbi:hypothetical protein [uncultured Microscilla sp.]|uniref:hypothetical protein n=1 Tax=uncultured Microscilla sp. TaxID=432653 RepID=UPI002603D7B9|nr:hypothetical protein [uncultured Microscilla sp.]